MQEAEVPGLALPSPGGCAACRGVLRGAHGETCAATLAHARTRSRTLAHARARSHTLAHDPTRPHTTPRARTRHARARHARAPVSWRAWHFVPTLVRLRRRPLPATAGSAATAGALITSRARRAVRTRRECTSWPRRSPVPMAPRLGRGSGATRRSAPCSPQSIDPSAGRQIRARGEHR